VPVFVLGEFVRVATHPRILSPPSPLDVVLTALERLTESPSCRILEPGADYPRLFAEVCRAADLRGNRAFDAQIAAVCLEHGAEDIVTFDRDFARIPGIRRREPGDVP
jgi:predicted nucleic acid-binding protein